MTARFIVGDVFDVLASLPDGSVDLVLTSPPFLALRSYLPSDHPDKGREIGSEATPADFLDRLLDVVEACDRVLAPHGSLVFELGDTYTGSGGSGGDYLPGGIREGQPGFGGSAERQCEGNAEHWRLKNRERDGWPLDKSLCGIPTLFAWSLAYGRNLLRPERETEQWRVRNLVAWCRPNPPVGALGDKFRPATSYLTVACKARDRYFDLDAVRGPGSPNTHARTAKGVESRPNDGKSAAEGRGGGWATLDVVHDTAGAPPLDWWSIPTHPYKGAHYACVDAETEALTPNGWRTHAQLRDGDMIAVYDQSTGRLSWQRAEFHRYSYSGALVAVDKRETSQRLTPNHRTLVRTRAGVERVIDAADLRPSHRLPVAAPFDMPPALDDPGSHLAELLGWYVAEGSSGTGRSVRIYQSATVNGDKCDHIRRLLHLVGADYSERSRLRSTLSPRMWEEVTWTVRGDVAAWLLATAPAKRLPAAVIGWSESSCSALLDGLIAGDGHTRPSGRRAFIQRDRETIDTAQALICRLGLRSTAIRRRDGQWSLTIGERTWLSLRGTNGKSDPVGRVHYTGTVWCPSVPTTFWLARRDGRPFITGNTWPPDLLVRPILAMCPKKVCRVCGQPSRRIVDAQRIRPKDDLTRRVTAGEYRRNGHDHAPEVGWEFARATVGWSDCGHGGDWRPGLVLDPFAGSGTTLAVATGHGRDAIGIDLDARNARLARERVGMFLEVVESAQVAS